ncbi:MAG: hypothetical protein MUF73_04610 [Rhodobacteraceae bacterium]|jgi:hypothetical protein|nr:hypothetical protein [Paracoccaceae bacterium]
MSQGLASELLSCLPRGGAVVSVGLMRGAMVDAFAVQRPDLRIVDLVSEPALVAHPGFAPVALMAADGDGVAVAEGECRAAPQRRVGPGLLEARATGRRLADLGRVLGGLRGVALLCLAPVPGHDALLRHVLPILRERGIMVWWTVGVDNAAGVLGAAAMAGLIVYRFDADGGPVPDAGPDGAGRAVTTVLLVPPTAWTPHGLDRLFAGLAGPGPLVVPATRGHGAALLDRLTALPAARPGRAAPGKRFVPVGTHLLADAGEIVTFDGVAYLRIAPRSTVTFAVMPPLAGPCDTGFVLGAPVSADHAAALRIGAAGAEARVVVDAEWSQLRLDVPLWLDPAQGPMTLTLRDLRPGGAGHAALLVRGIEVVARQVDGGASVGPRPLLPHTVPGRLAS